MPASADVRRGRAPLPVVRSHERIDFKRCQKKWYWHWRRGLIPNGKTFGALDLGTWVHAAMEAWYGTGFKRVGNLVDHFNTAANTAIEYTRTSSVTIPEHVWKHAYELQALGAAMCAGYLDHYGTDPTVYVLRTEIPLEFSMPSRDGRGVIATYKLKPDMVYRDEYGGVWLMENKTATSIRTGHLVIDDQARPYAAMATRSLVLAGVIRDPEVFRGVTYNFLRKAEPDPRKRNDKGHYLNRNGHVSQRQPPPFFLRHQIVTPAPARRMSLLRARNDTEAIVATTNALRTGVVRPDMLLKTPHRSCERFCDYFGICTAEENGADIRDSVRHQFRVEDPYAYGETTDEPISFEMG